MVRWGINGRPVSEDNSSGRNIPKKPPRRKPPRKPKTKLKSHIQIINKNEVIDKNMEINILARLLDENDKPIANAEIKVVDNNRFIRSLKTSAEGYFMFYGGYIGRYHSFVFSFKGNDKIKPCNSSLIIA